ncbi:FAD-binding oxidoreductase [Edaphobacter sp. HDX4]
MGRMLYTLTGHEGERVVATPQSAEEVASVLVFAKAHHLNICPLGGGTKQQWGRGATPQIYLSLARLNRLVEHPWQDLTCTVQAGCTWSSLQRSLALHGQFIAMDPLFQDRATVGGILATNDCGSLRQRYGSLRDLVIGMTLVLADGSIVRTGGKVVKNVAGYDLPKLLTGSLGTLAVITEASFRLHSLPKCVQAFTVDAPRASTLAPLLAKIRASHLLSQALQISCIERQFRLSIALTAHAEAGQVAILRSMVAEEGLSAQEDSGPVGAARESLFRSSATVLRVATLPSQVCEFGDGLQDSFSGIEISSVSDAVGSHWIALQGSARAVSDAVNRIRTRSGYPGLTVSAVQIDAEVDIPAFDIPSRTFQLMRAIKDQFDPDHLLNPGKYLGI